MIDDDLQDIARDMAEVKRLLTTVAEGAERINRDMHAMRADTGAVFKSELAGIRAAFEGEPAFARMEQRFDRIDAALADILGRVRAAGGEGR